ncbi:unnamed protein product [Schistosoma turkestanicum]|nr:unnamed protein product [Schistosoma turkestanicum]
MNGFTLICSLRIGVTTKNDVAFSESEPVYGGITDTSLSDSRKRYGILNSAARIRSLRHFPTSWSDMKVDWKCPDWKNYTLDSPQMKEHVEKLAKLGLKDPWARNYAWHYLPNFYKSRSRLISEIIFKKFPHGVALGIAASLIINGFDKWRKGEFTVGGH